MHDLGLSPSSVQSVLQRQDWIELYKNELKDRCSELKEVDFPEGYFVAVVKPEMEKALHKELAEESKELDVRRTIQRWRLLSDFKAQSLLRLILLFPHELSLSREITDKYKDVPLGPQESEIVEGKTTEELERWQEGNIAVFFTGTSIKNILGLFVSELFFTVEAMARALCIGSCLEFAIKSVLPAITIQHDEINKTLRRLGNEDKEKVSCKLCSLSENCIRSHAYICISMLYELFYHFRVIKDYRLEFYFKPELIPFLVNEYMQEGFEIICTLDKALDRVFHNYMISPLTLVDHKEKIQKIFREIKT